MSKKNILFAITNGFWLIQPEYADASAGLVQKILNGDFAFETSIKTEADADSEQLSVGCFVVSPLGEVIFGNRYNPFLNATPGSTAVIGISGPIMKYDNCGDLGTKSYSQLLSKAKANPNISSALLVIDSPGGTVDGTQELATEIKAFNKPIVSLVDGLMASAAYWIGSSANEVIANNETAMIGSIGTMISFTDMQPVYEKAGVKFHTIYADDSKDKNKDFIEARKGNYALLKEKLNSINDVFVSSVKSNRPGIAANALTGKTFMAADAVKQKLIDGIGDFSYAVARAQALATKDISNDTKPNNNMKKITLLASQAAMLAICGATIEAGKDFVEVELTDELVGKIDSGLSANYQLTADLKTTKEKITLLETDLKVKGDKIIELEGQNPGASNPMKAGNEKTGEETTDTDKAVWDIPHNKAALNNPLFN